MGRRQSGLRRAAAVLALASIDVSDSADRITPAVDVARDYITWRFYNPLAPAWLPTPRNLRFRAARRTLDGIVYGMIRERRESGEDRGDLLSMFMLARDEETGESMSDVQLRDEVMTMLMAGHESTAVSLTWVFYVFGRYPEIQARLQAEVDAALNGRAPGAEDLPSLPYTRMVIEETMRLYPVVWALSRQAVEEDTLCGYCVPAGGYVTLLLYFIHRHPEIWERPDQFEPERFSPERSESRPAGAYAPFGAGPRGCIGRQFAMMEAQIILATVAQRYQIRLADDRPVELEPHLSLRPKGGVPVLLDQRS